MNGSNIIRYATTNRGGDMHSEVPKMKGRNRAFAGLLGVFLLVMTIFFWRVMLPGLGVVAIATLGAKLVYTQMKANRLSALEAERAIEAQRARETLASTPRKMVPPMQMRVTDAERDVVIKELAKARETGALDAVEFDERMSVAAASKTREDLLGLTDDLPRESGGMVRYV